jgi:hypothetical protein
MASLVYMIPGVQRNLTRLPRLLPMIKGNYYTNHNNEFISTKVTQEHWWDKLGEHIAFYSSKQFYSSQGKA